MTALILADVLQTGNGRGVETLYGPALGLARKMDPPVRAALMQGFRMAHDLGYMRLDPLPRAADLLTRQRDDVLSDLLNRIRQLSQADMRAIAQCDYGVDEERHLRALSQVIGPNEGRFPEGDAVHPGGVVKWNAHNPKAVGFTPCLSLLCVNAVYRNDIRAEVAFLWSQLGAHLTADETGEFRPILNAIRYLFETDPDWSPYPTWNDLLIRGQGIALPWRASET